MSSRAYPYVKATYNNGPVAGVGPLINSTYSVHHILYDLNTGIGISCYMKITIRAKSENQESLDL